MGTTGRESNQIEHVDADLSLRQRSDSSASSVEILKSHAAKAVRGLRVEYRHGRERLELTAPAKQALEETVDRFRNLILRKSETLAKSQKLDTVSTIHVKRAEDGMRSRRPRGRLYSSIGGVLTGTSLSLILSAMYRGEITDFSKGSVLLLLMVFGLVLMFYEHWEEGGVS